MDRRAFIAGAIATPAAILAAPAIVSAAPLVTWRCQSGFSRISLAFGSTERIARQVRNQTDGRFELQVFATGEIVPTLKVLEAVDAQILACGHTLLGYQYASIDKALIFGTGVPFGLNARQHRAWWNQAGGSIVNRALARQLDVAAMPCGDFGHQTGGWFREPVRRPAGLKGLKMAIPRLGGDIMKRLGAAVVDLPGGELFPALQSGVVDAVDWIGLHEDTSIGLHEVVRYCYSSAWWETTQMVHLAYNRTMWASLPGAYRRALRQACAAEHGRMLRRFNRANAEALKRLRADHPSVEMRRYPASVIWAAKRASTAEMRAISAENPDFRRAWNSLRAYKARL